MNKCNKFWNNSFDVAQSWLSNGSIPTRNDELSPDNLNLKAKTGDLGSIWAKFDMQQENSVQICLNLALIFDHFRQTEKGSSDANWSFWSGNFKLKNLKMGRWWFLVAEAVAAFRLMKDCRSHKSLPLLQRFWSSFQNLFFKIGVKHSFSIWTCCWSGPCLFYLLSVVWFYQNSF